MASKHTQQGKEERRLLLRGMYRAGFSIDQIANMLNVTPRTVKNYLCDAGLTEYTSRDHELSTINDYLKARDYSNHKIRHDIVIVQGKRYIDVTGDVIDCGCSYWED